MENYALTKKIETIIIVSIIAFVAFVIAAICSIVAVGVSKQKIASYDRLIVEMNAEQTRLEQGIAVNGTSAFLEQKAHENGKIKDTEIIVIPKK